MIWMINLSVVNKTNIISHKNENKTQQFKGCKIACLALIKIGSLWESHSSFILSLLGLWIQASRLKAKGLCAESPGSKSNLKENLIQVFSGEKNCPQPSLLTWVCLSYKITNKFFVGKGCTKILLFFCLNWRCSIFLFEAFWSLRLTFIDHN